MSPQPNGGNDKPQPPSLPPSLPENAASDLVPQPSVSVSTVPYNNNHQNLENFSSFSPSLLPTMFVNPSFPDTLYDHDELETQFGRLNISPNNPPHHHQSHFQNNNNGGVGSILGNNNSLVGFDDYLESGVGIDDHIDYIANECYFDSINPIVYMQQQQQGFFDGSENLRFFQRSSNFDQLSAIFNTNNNPYEYYGGVVPGARNGCTPAGQYDNSVYYPNNNNRYPLLGDENMNDMIQSRQRVKLSNLENLRGSIFMVAKDQEGCKFLQKKFEERKPEEIDMIFREVRPYVRELMVDQFGHFFMHKFFEVCNLYQMNQLLLIFITDRNPLLAICVDTHGTRTMQKFLEYLATEEQRICLVSALQHITLDLCKNTNGHHVIRHCLKIFTLRENKQILDVVVLHCIDIATDKSGCCVLQQCVEHAQGEHRERLVHKITKNALLLSENRYGNYVVQYLLGLGIRRITNDVLTHLKSNYVYLSMNKFGSNVVEKCLKEGDVMQVDQIILEIISHNKFLMVLQDSYGNYVAQSALDRAQGHVRDQMVRAIQNHYPSLHSHPHGKRVFARINKQRRPNNNMFGSIF